MTDQPSDHFDPSNSLVYFTQKTFVFNDEGKFLTLRRSETAPTRPLKWDLPGGAYEKGESPEESARREIREEVGLEVRNMRPIGLASELNKAGEYWVTAAYRAEAEHTNVQLSYEHIEYHWVTKEEFLKLKSSDKWRHIAQTYLE